MDLLEYIKKSSGFFTKKSNQSYEFVKKKVNWTYAFIVYYIVALIASLQTISMDSLFNPMYIPYLGIATIPITLLGSAIIIPISIFMGVGIMFLFLKAVGGKSDFLETLKFWLSILLLPALINLVLIPLTYIPYLLKSQNTILAFDALIALIGIVVLIATLVVSIKTFSRLHQISTLRTITALIVLPMALMLLIMVTVFMIITTLGL